MKEITLKLTINQFKMLVDGFLMMESDGEWANPSLKNEASDLYYYLDFKADMAELKSPGEDLEALVSIYKEPEYQPH